MSNRPCSIIYLLSLYCSWLTIVNVTRQLLVSYHALSLLAQLSTTTSNNLSNRREDGLYDMEFHLRRLAVMRAILYNCMSSTHPSIGDYACVTTENLDGRSLQPFAFLRLEGRVLACFFSSQSCAPQVLSSGRQRPVRPTSCRRPWMQTQPS